MFAHGVGARGDLPLPLPFFVWALGLALVLSFVGLVMLWPQPRLRQLAVGRPLAAVGKALPAVALALGLGLYLLSLTAGWIGRNVVIENILPVTLYVTVWVGGVLAAGLVGDVWAALNPFKSIATVADRRSDPKANRDAEGPDWGLWPATVGLIIFLFYELSHPSGAEPRTLAVILSTHLVGVVLAAAVWGRHWVMENEPFTVLFRTVGAMGPIFHDSERLRLRPPLSGLAVMSVRSGTAALLLTAIGGTSFDGFSESSIGRDIFADLTGWTFAAAEFVGLLLSIGVVAALYGYGVWWTARVTDLDRGQAARTFAPSLVPILFGYTVAHYFQLFVDNIQVFVFRLADPFGWGWNIAGLADNVIWQIDPDVTAWIQVAAMLIGHVGAVVVAHDIAVERLAPAVATRSQLAMVFVMIAYSALGLWLLLTA